MKQANTKPQATAQIRSNVAIHDLLSSKYDARHGEIFNDVEQRRLRGALSRALGCAHFTSGTMRALDVGCGTGNLSRHLLELGAQVVAADVSANFLDVVRARFDGAKISTLQLNGVNLVGADSSTFDFVATYSVLHHIPDYLGAVDEMARVCKVGGVVYFDHEPTPQYWESREEYLQFLREVREFDWRKFLVLSNYVGKVRRLFNPKFANEGDIHVWADDHIEWSRIEAKLGDRFELVLSEDYLLFRKGYRRSVYERYEHDVTDTRVMAFRKLRP